MTTPALEVRGITAGYNNRPVLHGATLSLPPGTATGLLGRNGSGKSTLMLVALGLKAPNAGDAQLFGAPAWDAEPAIRARLGFVPQLFDAYHWLSVSTCLEFVGSCYPNWNHDYVADLRQRWLPNGYEYVGELSPGQKQRVATLLAIGHRPDLLVLDEPVAAMDPASRKEFFDELLQFKHDVQQTVLLSSHITSDIERFCSHVAIMHDGQIILHEALDELRARVFAFPESAVTALPDASVLVKDAGSAWVMDPPAALLANVAGQPLVLEDLFLAMTS